MIFCCQLWRLNDLTRVDVSMSDEVEFWASSSAPHQVSPFWVSVYCKEDSVSRYVHATPAMTFSRVCKRYRKPRLYRIETDVICASKTHDQAIGTSVGGSLGLN